MKISEINLLITSSDDFTNTNEIAVKNNLINSQSKILMIDDEDNIRQNYLESII